MTKRIRSAVALFCLATLAGWLAPSLSIAEPSAPKPASAKKTEPAEPQPPMLPLRSRGTGDLPPGGFKVVPKGPVTPKDDVESDLEDDAYDWQYGTVEAKKLVQGARRYDPNTAKETDRSVAKAAELYEK